MSKKQTKLPRILICGSMTHYEAMLYCRDQLNQRKIPTLVPDNEQAVVELPQKTFLETKRDLSQKWLRKIKSSRTYGILVVNESKNGKDNYIGANTFAEIVIAFNASKQIFLLHDLYSPYKDELLAWKAVPLLGHLEDLISTYLQAERETEKVDLPQPELFPV